VKDRRRLRGSRPLSNPILRGTILRDPGAPFERPRLDAEVLESRILPAREPWPIMRRAEDQTSPHVEVDGVRVPTFVYGTAWKEDETSRLVGLALDAGFRGIDTANQRRHYDEAAVGEAVAQAIGAGAVGRDDLFLQSKFTSIGGQDHRLPYDRDAPVSTQVEQSFASTLEHFGVDHLDSYVLHGPTTRHGLAAGDWECWRAMERLHASGRTRLLGVSNVALDQLEALVADAAVKPAIVQNRCFAVMGWDRAVRAFCRSHGILYQGFSLLTANPQVVNHPRTHELAHRYGAGPAQVIFRFAQQAGMIALTGTTSASHMKQNLEAYAFELEDEEVSEIERMLG
jgi:diketogulonate reductase-like aldo/keto reductase